MKKNVYFVQANNVYGSVEKNTYIPYSTGCIQAYCMQSSIINDNYKFMSIIYSRITFDEWKERLDNPFMILFSCSVWNMEYNKTISKKIKELYPDCLITFGGHSVSYEGDDLEKYEFVDFLTHRFGEEPTAGILECLAGYGELCDVANISYRSGENIITTKNEPQTGIDYPSPYLTGVFDDIINDNIKFSVLFETNRGCPNSCSFCDWGSLKSKVRLFPMDRVKAEIDWFVSHKVEFVFCTDGNFCLFSRDREIADYIIECKKKFGYPKIFRVCFTKNRMDFVYEIGKKFCDNGLDKAQTISFQSMNDVVLKNVGRKNLPTKVFKDLMKRYNDANMLTFSELILGLPGETYESFCSGLASIIENGQHYAVNIYPCEIIPNAELARKEYLDRFGIKSTRVPFRLIHSNKRLKNDDITEYSVYITSTNSMSQSDWVKSYIFAQYVVTFHNLGLLRDVAVYYHNEYDIAYDELYKSIIDYSTKNKDSLLGNIYTKIKGYVTGILEGRNELVVTHESLGDTLWGFDEIIFFSCYENIDLFYGEVQQCLSVIADNDITRSLFEYQKNIIKKIGVDQIIIESDYDFYNYFKNVFLNEYKPLTKRKTVLTVKDSLYVDNIKEFAKEVVWYGRNKKATDYSAGLYELTVQ